jgi:hypothetical protein
MGNFSKRHNLKKKKYVGEVLTEKEDTGGTSMQTHFLLLSSCSSLLLRLQHRRCPFGVCCVMGFVVNIAVVKFVRSMAARVGFFLRCESATFSRRRDGSATAQVTTFYGLIHSRRGRLCHVVTRVNTSDSEGLRNGPYCKTQTRVPRLATSFSAFILASRLNRFILTSY